MKCNHENPCARYDDNRCCIECLEDDCEYICGHIKDKPCEYIKGGDAVE